jgi:hypothetical protein
MKYYGNFSLFEIDNMHPYEFEIYSAQLYKKLEEQKNG